MAQPRLRFPPIAIPGPDTDPGPDEDQAVEPPGLDLRTRLLLVALFAFWAALPAAGLTIRLWPPAGLAFAGLGLSSLVVALLLGLEPTPSTPVEEVPS